MKINLTNPAADKIREFLTEEDGEDLGIRLQVLPGGCSGFQYSMGPEKAPEDEDEIFEVNGVKMFIDPFSAQYLDGVRIEWVDSFAGSGFAFKNPNASGGCGCGSSFTV